MLANGKIIKIQFRLFDSKIGNWMVILKRKLRTSSKWKLVNKVQVSCYLPFCTLTSNCAADSNFICGLKLLQILMAHNNFGVFSNYTTSAEQKGHIKMIIYFEPLIMISHKTKIYSLITLSQRLKSCSPFIRKAT